MTNEDTRKEIVKKLNHVLNEMAPLKEDLSRLNLGLEAGQLIGAMTLIDDLRIKLKLLQ